MQDIWISLLSSLHHPLGCEVGYPRKNVHAPKNENNILATLYWMLEKAETYNFYRGNLTACKEAYDKVLLFTEENGINVTQIKQSYRIAKVYLLYGDLETVLKIYQKGIEGIKTEEKEKKRYSESVLADEYINAAHTLCLMGRYKDAITYYEKAIVQMEPTGKKGYKSACLFYIGYANERMGKKKHAKKYYNESFLTLDPSKDYSKFSFIDYKKEFFLTMTYYGYCWPNEILLEVCDNYIENGEYTMAAKVCSEIEIENNYGDFEGPHAKVLLQRRETLKPFVEHNNTDKEDESKNK